MSKSLLVVAALLSMAIAALAQDKTKLNDDPNTRSVQGIVTNAGSKPLSDANVQLKDMKTLQIRSFITHEDGAYHFAGLNTNTEYELQAADQAGKSSGTKRLTIFDSRKNATVDLKLK